jgi:hypothetical protein
MLCCVVLFNRGFVLDATLVCWIVAGRLRRHAAQAGQVTGLSPDIVCLQEVIPRAVRPWMLRSDRSCRRGQHVAPTSRRRPDCRRPVM